jgi:hypothetical protein
MLPGTLKSKNENYLSCLGVVYSKAPEVSHQAADFTWGENSSRGPDPLQFCPNKKPRERSFYTKFSITCLQNAAARKGEADLGITKFEDADSLQVSITDDDPAPPCAYSIVGKNGTSPRT